ncbi:MAG: DUF4256 domain-containing protein [Candidatus Gracilibacteria bacterium]|jgi:hypothetical protein
MTTKRAGEPNIGEEVVEATEAQAKLSEGAANATVVDETTIITGEAITQAVAHITPGDDLSVAAESEEADPRLATFKADFDEDPKLKAKCSWTEIRNRLLANEGHYLTLAKAMEGGGVLFGIDKEGNPLISDRGDEPIMKGMNYKDTRDRVLYKHTRLDIAGEMVLSEDKQPISTGYEMFPFLERSTRDNKSTEILQYESHTRKPFVKSLNGKECRSSWLESGEYLPRMEARQAVVRPYSIHSYDVGAEVEIDPPTFTGKNTTGVRRLLRVRKAMTTTGEAVTQAAAPGKLQRLDPERETQVIQLLKTRFEAKENRDLCPALDWSRAERALRKNPKTLWTVDVAEKNGHEPAIYFSDERGFDIGTLAKEPPLSTRNCVYDEDAWRWTEPKPDEEFNGNAESQAEAMGWELMGVEQGNHIAANTPYYVERGWRWYKTDAITRRKEYAVHNCSRSGNVLRRSLSYSFNHGADRGWGGSLRVKFVD